MSLDTIKGLTQDQLQTLRRRRLSRATLERRLAEGATSDPTLAGLPPAAIADLRFRPAKEVSLAAALRLGEKLRDSLVMRPRLAKRRVHIVGSARRGKLTIKDLDLLVVLPRSAAANPLSTLRIAPAQRRSVQILASYANGSRRRSLVVHYGRTNYCVDLFLAYDDEMPYAMMHHTGSHRYNIRIRAHAKSRGWRLNQYGLYIAGTDRRVRGSRQLNTEGDLARFLGVTPRPPHLRNY